MVGIGKWLELGCTGAFGIIYRGVFSGPYRLAPRLFWESSGSSSQLLQRSLKISLDNFERSPFPWDFWDSWLCLEQNKGCSPHTSLSEVGTGIGSWTCPSKGEQSEGSQPGSAELS